MRVQISILGFKGLNKYESRRIVRRIESDGEQKISRVETNYSPGIGEAKLSLSRLN